MIEVLPKAAVDKFIASQECQDLIDEGLLGKDADGTPWVFQGSDDDRPFRDPKGTGKAAIVLTSNGIWGVNAHNTADFPLLTALAYVDVSRKPDGTVLTKNGKVRAQSILRRVKDVFHDPANKDHLWPGLYVVACVMQSGGYSVMPIPGSDNMHRGAVNFEVSL